MSCFRTVILIFFLFIAGLRRMVKKTEHKNLEARNLDYTYMLDKLLSLKVNQVLQ